MQKQKEFQNKQPTTSSDGKARTRVPFQKIDKDAKMTVFESIKPLVISKFEKKFGKKVKLGYLYVKDDNSSMSDIIKEKQLEEVKTKTLFVEASAFTSYFQKTEEGLQIQVYGFPLALDECVVVVELKGKALENSFVKSVLYDLTEEELRKNMLEDILSCAT